MMDPSALGRAALLGTGSGAFPDVPLTGTAADDLVVRRRDEPIERRILLAAGARSWLRRAGRPTLDAAAPPPGRSPAERRPAVSPSVARRIDDFFRGGRTALLPEALALLNERGLRLPHADLPRALARCPKLLRPQMAAVVGERGAWLAARNRSWRWVLDHVPAPEPDDSTDPGPDVDALRRSFDTGRLDDRVLAMCRLREVDPAGARELLRAAWSGENANDRGLLLSALSVGLGPDDHALLVAAASDRIARVRAEARDLLGRLPGSDLNRRFEARARTLLEIAEDTPAAPLPRGFLASLLRGPSPVGGPRLRLKVTIPRDLPPDWSEDGVRDEIKPGIGPQISRAVQVLSRVAPSVWAGDRMPADVVPLFGPDDWPLLLAVGRSVVSRRDQAWAAPLWDQLRLLSVGEPDPYVRSTPVPRDLVALMPRADLAMRLEPLLREGIAGSSGEWLPFLEAWPGSWPEDLAGLWLDGLRARIERGTPRGIDDDGLVAWQRSVAIGACKLPVSVLERVPSLPRPVGSASAMRTWTRLIETFNDHLSARIDLQRDLDGLPAAPLDPLAPPDDGDSP